MQKENVLHGTWQRQSVDIFLHFGERFDQPSEHSGATFVLRSFELPYRTTELENVFILILKAAGKRLLLL